MFFLFLALISFFAHLCNCFQVMIDQSFSLVIFNIFLVLSIQVAIFYVPLGAKRFTTWLPFGVAARKVRGGSSSHIPNSEWAIAADADQIFDLRQLKGTTEKYRMTNTLPVRHSPYGSGLLQPLKVWRLRRRDTYSRTVPTPKFVEANFGSAVDCGEARPHVEAAEDQEEVQRQGCDFISLTACGSLWEKCNDNL